MLYSRSLLIFYFIYSSLNSLARPQARLLPPLPHQHRCVSSTWPILPAAEELWNSRPEQGEWIPLWRQWLIQHVSWSLRRNDWHFLSHLEPCGCNPWDRGRAKHQGRAVYSFWALGSSIWVTSVLSYWLNICVRIFRLELFRALQGHLEPHSCCPWLCILPTDVVSFLLKFPQCGKKWLD